MLIWVHYEGIIAVYPPIYIPLVHECLGFLPISIIYSGRVSHQFAIVCGLHRSRGWSPQSSQWSSATWESPASPGKASTSPRETSASARETSTSFREVRVVILFHSYWRQFSTWWVHYIRSHCSLFCSPVIHYIYHSSDPMSHLGMYVPLRIRSVSCHRLFFSHHSHWWKDMNGLSEFS